MHVAADRGGPFVRDTDVALVGNLPQASRFATSHTPSSKRGRAPWDGPAALLSAEREGAAPGTEFRFASTDESSPIRIARKSARLRAIAMTLAAGCLAIAAWHAADAAYVHAKAWLGQRLLLVAWNEARAGHSAVKPWPWADTHPVARLTVPEHRVELLVLAGASGRTLAWGPGHVEGTATPGLRGNAVVTAHRDTHFAFLRDLVPGDRIVVETAAGIGRGYRVERSFVADRRALKLPADDHATTLALVTCYPFDAVDPGTPLRYAVIARGE
jgi:sortase A